MKYTLLYPEMYRDFSCVGSDCIYNCCQEWRIIMNKADYQKLRNLRAEKQIKEKITNCVKRLKVATENNMYAELILNEDKYCNFFDCDKLCSLQKSCGGSVLPTVCQTFPRKFYAFSSTQFGVRTVVPACEVVVRQLMNADIMRFILQEDILKGWEVKGIIITEQSAVMTNFLPIKSCLIDLLQNREYTMDERMILLGMALQNYKKQLEEPSVDIEQWIKQTSCFAKGSFCKYIIESMEFDKGFYSIGLMSIFSKVPDNFFYLCSKYGAEIIEEKVVNLNIEKVLCDDRNFRENSKQGEVFLENFIVNEILASNIPVINADIWEEYSFLVCLYRLVRFLIAAFYDTENGLENAVLPFVRTMRIMLNSKSFKEQICNLLKEKDQNTLAPLAMIIKS